MLYIADIYDMQTHKHFKELWMKGGLSQQTLWIDMRDFVTRKQVAGGTVDYMIKEGCKKYKPLGLIHSSKLIVVSDRLLDLFDYIDLDIWSNPIPKNATVVDAGSFIPHGDLGIFYTHLSSDANGKPIKNIAEVLNYIISTTGNKYLVKRGRIFLDCGRESVVRVTFDKDMLASLTKYAMLEG